MNDICKISLIICSRNRSAQLNKFLLSIPEDEIIAVQAEVVLVNNNSEDDSLVLMQKFQELQTYPVTVIDHKKTGLAMARNIALEAARGDILIFTDDDCYLTKGYLLKVREIFDSQEFEYCGGQIWRFQSQDSLIGTLYFDKKIIIPPKSLLAAGVISGANMIFTAKVIKQVGLFDELLGAGSSLGSAEDIDYLSRASSAGFTGAKLPELIIWHHHQRSPGSVEEYKIIVNYDYGRGAYYLKNIISGRMGYLLLWIRRSGFNWIQLLREIIGACYYLLLRIQKARGA